MNPITYISDQLSDYTNGLTECKTLSELSVFVASYKEIAEDAIADLPKNDKEFKEWQSGLKKERKGIFAGDKFIERFGALLMPATMIKVGMVASQYNAPWGCAYLQMKKAGVL